MSRVGEQPITIPEGATVKLENGRVFVEGPLGQLEQELPRPIKVEIKEGKIFVSRKKDNKLAKSLHGLIRSLVANMIEGVTKGFSKSLELHGTGYRAKLEGENLTLEVGFSHPVIVKPPEGIKFELRKEKEIKVRGIDKQLVGTTAARIRAIKKPEPYKGKGVRYRGEVIRRKPGKAAKVGAGEAKYE